MELTTTKTDNSEISVFGPNIVVTPYTLSFSSLTTPQQAVDAIHNIISLEDSSRYWLIWWAICMQDRNWMDAIEIAALIPSVDTKTVQNWYSARNRWPKSEDDIPKSQDGTPHPDWHSSYYIETASLDDDDYRDAVQWIIAQEEKHGRIASIAKLRKYLKGEDPYKLPPKMVRWYAKSKQDAIDQLRRKLPENWSGEVTTTVLETEEDVS